ncbi:hypothetical protein V5799_005327 [Amblyomma americanum]|uniref:Carboxylesterase type B domain-containing protein n=1 Tax=Amblyomma americanum TaxID=6943 RepID=A0AAQ4DZK1_AMBAM
MAEMLGDVFHVCPLQYFAQELSAAGHQVFVYVFSAKPSQSQWPEEQRPALYEDLPFLFGAPFSEPGPTWERLLSARMIDLLADFVHRGVLPTLDDGTAWPPYKHLRPAVVEIGSSGLRMLASGFRDGICRRLRPHLLGNRGRTASIAGCVRGNDPFRRE